MTVKVGDQERALTGAELFEAHSEFVMSWMADEIQERTKVPRGVAADLASKAYDRYCAGDGDTEGECVDWVIDQFKQENGIKELLPEDVTGVLGQLMDEVELPPHIYSQIYVLYEKAASLI